MEHSITLIAAILGSGFLSTALTTMLHKWRPDRHVDALESWMNESKLLKSLEEKANLTGSENSNQPRDLAVSIAARTQITSAVAARLVPRENFRVLMLMLSGLTLSLAGLILTLACVANALDASEGLKISLYWILTLVSVVIFGFGVTMFLMGWTSERYQDVMRTEIQKSLDPQDQSTQPHPYAKKYCWLAGQRPKFYKRHQFALRADVRQAFYHYMVNVDQSPSRATATIKTNTSND